MSKIMKVYEGIIFACAVLLVLSILISCRAISPSLYAGTDGEITYSIAVTVKGDERLIRVVDATGREIPRSQFPLLIKSDTRNMSLHSIVLNQYRGDHYDVITVDGVPYVIPLPH
jgi:hypothetical protein